MIAFRVVVGDEFVEEMSQMDHAKDYEMADAFVSDKANGSERNCARWPKVGLPPTGIRRVLWPRCESFCLGAGALPLGRPLLVLEPFNVRERAAAKSRNA